MRLRLKPDYRIALAGAAALPVLIWWLGWYPGFASSDTIDQFGQIRSGVYSNFHPAIHTLYLEALSLGGSYPGLVTLIQLIALGYLLAYGAKWLMTAGVPGWLAVSAAWILGLSPAIAPTTLALWKDVPFGLFLLWAWIELLALAVDSERANRLWSMAGLGAALAGIWLFRGNGPITVIPMLLLLAWVHRDRLRGVAVSIGTAVAIVVVVLGPVYAVFDVRRTTIEPAQVFLPDVAASLNDEPETFTDEDLDLVEDVAPLSVWTNRYDCYDSTPLLFDPGFDQTPVREDPGEYRSLELDVLVRDFDSVLEHRVCAFNFVYWPPQPADAYFHRPPYDIPANDIGLSRDTRAQWAFEVTDRVWRWAEVESRLWFTWRPAIVVLPALLTIVVLGIVSSTRRFLLPSALFLAHLANVAVTSPAQEFRYAYPLYLTAVLTITLLWPAISGHIRDRDRSEAV